MRDLINWTSPRVIVIMARFPANGYSSELRMFSTMSEFYHFAAGAAAGVVVSVTTTIILRIKNDSSTNVVNQGGSKVEGDQAGRDIRKR
jgi:hypothetical protein